MHAYTLLLEIQARLDAWWLLTSLGHSAGPLKRAHGVGDVKQLV
jgi:hypothetical protein